MTIEPALAGEPFDVRELTAGLGDVLLVGHDPSFSLTLHDLTGTQARMRKGGLAGISKGELVVLLRPAELAAIAQRGGQGRLTEPSLERVQAAATAPAGAERGRAGSNRRPRRSS